MWWPAERSWFAGLVAEYHAFDAHWVVTYDDGAAVTHNLLKTKYRLEGDRKAARRVVAKGADASDSDTASDDDDDEKSASAAKAPRARATPAAGAHVVQPTHAGFAAAVGVAAAAGAAADGSIATDEGSKAVVDPQSGLAAVGHVATDAATGAVLEATLALVDVAQNIDKFYTVQVVAADASPTDHWCVCHWGRTGTKGQVKVDGPMPLAAAEALAAERFEAKTGVAWAARATAAPVPGKYVFKRKVYTAAGPKRVLWQYYVDDFVDGKATGWYNYAPEAAATVEGVWSEWRFNAWLDVRSVHSGYWDYNVDFNQLAQTNVKTQKRRTIRRVEVPAEEAGV